MLNIFPETVESVENIKELWFEEKEGLFDGTYELYVLCSYEETMFYEEQERLAAIKGVRDEAEQTVIYDDVSYAYPVYIAVYTESELEYAVIDKENLQIAYVFLQLKELEDSHVPEEYQIIYSNEPINIYVLEDERGVEIREDAAQ